MPDSANPLSRIRHIVVLMLENCSFDNLLGWLYDPEKPAPFNTTPPANFEGLYGKALSNPDSNGASVLVAKGSDPTHPLPDPGETYQDVYCQLYNFSLVPPLDQVPPNPPQPPSMQGFITDYAAQPKGTNHRMIMDCFSPTTVPVLSSVAYYYGVCDRWFSSIPSQTICNRSFAQAGTSSGYVNNEGGGTTSSSSIRRPRFTTYWRRAGNPGRSTRQAGW